MQVEILFDLKKSAKETGLDNGYTLMRKQLPVGSNNNKDYLNIGNGTSFVEEKDFQDVLDFGKIQKSLCLVNKKMKLLEDKIKVNYINFVKLSNHVGSRLIM